MTTWMYLDIMLNEVRQRKRNSVSSHLWKLNPKEKRLDPWLTEVDGGVGRPEGK